MARFPIILDVPDGRRDELIAALRHKFGPVGNPPRDRTPDELMAGVKAETVAMIKQWYRDWRRHQRENDDIEIS